MLYVEKVNARLREHLSRSERSVAYGQNIAAGSRLSGLTRALGTVPGCTVINTPNSENTLMGLGIGLSLRGIRSCFVMKQLDFAFLGIDHLFNSVALIRQRSEPVGAPFVLVTVVVDSGYEGPQASANNLATLAPFLRIPVFAPSTARSIGAAFDEASNSPVSIIGLSQKMMKQEISEDDDSVCVSPGWLLYPAKDKNPADHVTICLGFTGPFGLEFQRSRSERGLPTDVLIAYTWAPLELAAVTDLVNCYAKATIIDDSKAEPSPATNLAVALSEKRDTTDIEVIGRTDPRSWFKPSIDGADYEYASRLLS